MIELLFFICGFALCFTYFVFYKNTKVKITPNKSLSEFENIILSEQKILDQIPDQIIILNKEKNIIFANQSAKDRFGKNITNNHVAEILREPKFLEGIEDTIINKKSITIRTETKKPTFQVYESYIFPSPTFFLGNQKSIFILMRDLTEIFKIQQLKSDFVANVSHELRTPLQTIKLGLETINNENENKNEQTKNNFLPLMLKETSRMEDLIKDLLILSKIEQQEHIRPNSRINIKEIIDYVQKFYNKSLLEKNISLQVNLDETGLNIIGDKDKLIEIFSNLINNAIKYSDSNKNIFIESRLKSNQKLEIHVRDEGIGIPKDLLPRISERFFRVDNEKTRKINGTGLGLAIVKHLIKQHRGEFNIQSQEGKGTDITIFLPSYI
jgi:two-component system, OmpR family, phosphate regulon sensor histidine kinase PhoR